MTSLAALLGVEARALALPLVALHLVAQALAETYGETTPALTTGKVTHSETTAREEEALEEEEALQTPSLGQGPAATAEEEVDERTSLQAATPRHAVAPQTPSPEATLLASALQTRSTAPLLAAAVETNSMSLEMATTEVDNSQEEEVVEEAEEAEESLFVTFGPKGIVEMDRIVDLHIPQEEVLLLQAKGVANRNNRDTVMTMTKAAGSHLDSLRIAGPRLTHSRNLLLHLPHSTGLPRLPLRALPLATPSPPKAALRIATPLQNQEQEEQEEQEEEEATRGRRLPPLQRRQHKKALLLLRR